MGLVDESGPCPGCGYQRRRLTFRPWENISSEVGPSRCFGCSLHRPISVVHCTNSTNAPTAVYLVDRGKCVRYFKRIVYIYIYKNVDQCRLAHQYHHKVRQTMSHKMLATHKTLTAPLTLLSGTTPFIRTNGAKKHTYCQAALYVLRILYMHMHTSLF